MKKTLKVLVFSFLSLLFVTGCSTERSREEKTSAIINKIDSPFFITSMTPQTLMDKSGVMDGVLPFTYELILSFFIDEDVTGVDYSVKTQFVVSKGESFIPNTYGIFRIGDEKKFVELIEKEANAEIMEDQGMKFAIKESDGYCVTWNEEFAIVANIPMDLADMLTGGRSDRGKKMVDSCIEMIKAADDGETNEVYTNFLKNDADISMHYDGKGFFSYMEDMSMDEQAEIENMKDIVEGMSYELFIRFNDGSIELEMSSTLTDELKEDLKFISEKGINSKLLTYGKSAEPLMYGSYSVNIDGLLTYMEELMGSDELDDMEEGLNEMGMSMDDAKSALSGEILYIVESFSQVEETFDFGYGDPYTYKRTEPIFGIVLGVSDKSIIEKLFAGFSMQDLASMEEQVTELDLEDMPEFETDMGMMGTMIPEFYENGVVKMGDAYIFLQDEVLFMSNDKEWADQIASNNGVSINDSRNVTSENPFGFFVDFVALSKMDGLNDAEPFVNLFTEFYGSTSIEAGKFTLVLKDDSKNSLRIITELLSDMMNEWEKAGQEMLEEELNSALEDGFDALEEDIDIDIDEIEEGVEDALDKLGIN